MQKLLLLIVSALLFVSCQKELSYERVTEASPIDNAIPTPTVTICNQTWMLKNLDVSKYRDGSIIPEASTPAQWEAAANNGTGAWCYYENVTANGTVYGKLYNWYAVKDPRGLAPAGYHIPTDAEWETLVICLGTDIAAGGAMKEAGTSHWLAPNADATNSSKFTGLPGGYRLPSAVFTDIGVYGVFWSSTELDPGASLLRSLYNVNSQLYRYSFSKQYGFSVRCIKN